jgi:zinc and cadmium transporter
LHLGAVHQAKFLLQCQHLQGDRVIDTLALIVVTTAVSGLISIAAAAFFAYKVLGKLVDRMVSFSIGVLLSTALLHLLPEAIQTSGQIEQIFLVLLIGIFVFFLLNRFAILRHSHPEGSEHAHGHGEAHGHAHHHHQHATAGKLDPSTGWTVVWGDGFHNFADGVLIAAAFLADWRLGFITALSIMAHEIPQEVGDFMLLLESGFSRSKAFVLNLVSSMAAVAGGVVGYFALQGTQDLLPYAITIAAASFVYIAMADLIPYVHHRSRAAQWVPQVTLISAGALLMYVVTALAHGH